MGANVDPTGYVWGDHTTIDWWAMINNKEAYIIYVGEFRKEAGGKMTVRSRCSKNLRDITRGLLQWSRREPVYCSLLCTKNIKCESRNHCTPSILACSPEAACSRFWWIREGLRKWTNLCFCAHFEIFIYLFHIHRERGACLRRAPTNDHQWLYIVYEHSYNTLHANYP